MYLYPPTIFGCLWQSCHSMKLVVFCLASCVLRGSCGTWSLSVANVALCLARGCAQKEYQLTQKNHHTRADSATFFCNTPVCRASHPVVPQMSFKGLCTVFILASLQMCIIQKGEIHGPWAPLTALEVDWGQWGWMVLGWEVARGLGGHHRHGETWNAGCKSLALASLRAAGTHLWWECENKRATPIVCDVFLSFLARHITCAQEGFFPVPWLLLWPIPRGASTQSMHGADGLSKCVVSMRVANEKGIWAAELVGRARASVWAERETSRVRFSSAWKTDMNNLRLHALQA